MSSRGNNPVPEPVEGLVAILKSEKASLVVSNNGMTRCFFKKGVRDLENLLDHEPEFLRGAVAADKVVGKASAGMLAFGGVKEVHALTLSRLAIPVLEAAGIKYSYSEIVDHIVIPEGNDRCPLEKIVADATTPSEIVSTLREHFRQMRTEHGV